MSNVYDEDYVVPLEEQAQDVAVVLEDIIRGGCSVDYITAKAQEALTNYYKHQNEHAGD